jgi:hypothetical protein
MKQLQQTAITRPAVLWFISAKVGKRQNSTRMLGNRIAFLEASVLIELISQRKTKFGNTFG